MVLRCRLSRYQPATINTANGFQALFDQHPPAATTRPTVFRRSPPQHHRQLRNTADRVFGALLLNTTGPSSNTANGYQALFSNITGGENTANGFQALYSNTMGNYNTANGVQALLATPPAASNTADGLPCALEQHHWQLQHGQRCLIARFIATPPPTTTRPTGGAALYNNYRRHQHGHGYLALFNNTTGASNTANGGGALYYNNTGSYGQR